MKRKKTRRKNSCMNARGIPPTPQSQLGWDILVLTRGYPSPGRGYPCSELGVPQSWPGGTSVLGWTGSVTGLGYPLPLPRLEQSWKGPGSRDRGTDLGAETMGYLPPCGHTHTCKNSTFPILLMWAVIKHEVVPCTNLWKEN